MNKPLPKKPKTFEEFYKIKKKHAKHLTKTYQKQLKKKVRLSVKFDNLAEAKKKGKIHLIIEIRTNTLTVEGFIDSADTYKGATKLVSWPRGVEKSMNALNFLLGKDLPNPLIDRINQVPVARKSKLQVSSHAGNNMYSPGYHELKIKSSLLSSLEQGKQYELLTHEFDHVVRIAAKDITTYDQLKSETYAYHAQMLTIMNKHELKPANSAVDKYMEFAKEFDVYIKTYGFGDSRMKMEDRILEFFIALNKDKAGKTAWIKMTELVTFFDLIDEDDIVPTYNDVKTHAVGYKTPVMLRDIYTI